MKKNNLPGGIEIKVSKIYPSDYLTLKLEELQNDIEKMERLGICQGCVIALKAWIKDDLK